MGFFPKDLQKSKNEKSGSNFRFFDFDPVEFGHRWVKEIRLITFFVIFSHFSSFSIAFPLIADVKFGKIQIAIKNEPL